MTFKYSEVVPWGRSFDEYRRMFAMSERDLNLRIIGCGDGPASFNAEMYRHGRYMISCDPLYQMSANQIQDRIHATYENVIRQTRQNEALFVWTAIKSADELGKIRLAAMQQFIADFDEGKRAGRYIPGELPHLPFEERAFDLAVCSHFLFLYSDKLTLDFHKNAIEDMCRVASEARIFPLLNYNAEPSPHLEPLMNELKLEEYHTSIENVSYEFQRGGNKMLRVWRETRQ